MRSASSSLVWDSGLVRGTAAPLVQYAGAPLASDALYSWTVTALMSDGFNASLRVPASFGTGLFERSDWKARWITSRSSNATLYRREFTLSQTTALERATLFVSGLGYNVVTLNGHKVGDRCLDPGWTDYAKRVYYTTFNVTALLRSGSVNAVGVSLGAGWFFPPYLKEPSHGQLLLQLHVNGVPVMMSDLSWKAAKGPILSNSLYNGETYDARIEQTIEGWTEPGFRDNSEAWTPVVEATNEVIAAALVSQLFQPIRHVRALSPRSVNLPVPGRFVFDFGQNMAAVLRIQLREGQCAFGANITLRHAEILLHPPYGPSDGTLYTANLRTALATDVYICSGDGSAIDWTPSFTQHGFRYAEVSGEVGALSEDQIEALELHTDVQRTSSVTFSTPLLNAIQRAVVWSQKSNLMGLPTDCPQRDERKGWMGDAAVTAEEAIYNFDMTALYSRWVEAMVADQQPDGAVPDIVPAHGWWLRDGAPSYQSAFPTIVWALVRYYGDTSGVVFREHDGLVRYYEHFLDIANKTGLKAFPSNYGDWEPPACKGTADPGSCKISGPLVGAFSFLHDLWMGVYLFGASNHPDGQKWSKRCENEFVRFKPKFHDAFFNSSIGLYGLGRQTEQALPLFLDIVPPTIKPGVLAATIHDIINTHDIHLTSGILGVKFMLEVLAQEGRGDVAVDILMQDTFPSYGYMIKGGEHEFEPATTLWELWDSDTNGPSMNSRNHIMFGSVGSFFYKYLLGVTPLNPGYSRILIRPIIVSHPNLTHASGTVATPYGACLVSWATNISNQQIPYQLQVTVPIGTRGRVAVPLTFTRAGINTDKLTLIKESEHLVWMNGKFIPGPIGILNASVNGNEVYFEIGSGKFHFTVEYKTETVDNFATASSAANVTGKGLWVWSKYSPLNLNSSEEFFKWAAKETAQPVKTIYLEDEALTEGGNRTAELQRFLGMLDVRFQGGMNAAPLYGWNGGDGKFPNASVLAFVDAVLRMPEATHSASLAGISFDIEPRDFPDPSDYQQYALLLSEVRKKIDIQNTLRNPALPRLRLSIAGSWGYERKYVNCGAVGSNITLLECAVANVDLYILMNYRNSAYGCFCRPLGDKPNPPAYQCPKSGSPIAGNCTSNSMSLDGMIGKAIPAATAVKASRNKNARLSLGVETTCFPKSDWSDRKYQYKLSFCGTSTAFLEKQMVLTEKGLRTKGLWDGVADDIAPWSVEDFHALQLLEQHGQETGI